jgi:hypothetical protein
VPQLPSPKPKREQRSQGPGDHRVGAPYTPIVVSSARAAPYVASSVTMVGMDSRFSDVRFTPEIPVRRCVQGRVR